MRKSCFANESINAIKLLFFAGTVAAVGVVFYVVPLIRLDTVRNSFLLEVFTIKAKGYSSAYFANIV